MKFLSIDDGIYFCFNFVVIIILFLFSINGFAENSRFERISAEQGLSQMSVNAALQDSDGFIWFGTQDGLNRYDGYQFKVYRNDRTDPHSLGNNWINTLFEDRGGNLWIGTEGGLFKFDRQSDHFTRYVYDPDDPNSISGNDVWSIAEDENGHLWIGVYRAGLNALNPQTGRFIRYLNDAADADNISDNISDNKVTDVLVSHTNTVWAATNGGGLNRFNRRSGQFEHFVHHPDDNASLSNNRVFALFEDQAHHLWIGTAKGLNRFNPENELFSHYQFDAAPNGDSDDIFIKDIFGDSQNNLWIAPFDGGLMKFDIVSGQSDWFVHDGKNRHSLSSNRVRAMAEDRSGILWFGTRAGGINKYNPGIANFSHFSHQPDNPNSLKSNNIWALYQDKQGLIWIGSEFYGVSQFEPKTSTFKHYQSKTGDPHSISGKQVTAIYQDHTDALWFGSYTQGLNRFDKKTQTFSRFLHDPDDPATLGNSRRITAIIEDGEHALWFGSDNGLNRLDVARQKFTRYHYRSDEASSIGSDRIQALLEDSQGDIWIGTADQGLDRLDKSSGSFIHYRYDPDDNNSLGSNTVYAIYQDGDDILWLGTAAGLYRFDPSSHSVNHSASHFTHYGRQQGLSNDTVIGIMGDQAGFLWLTTTDGLNRFDPRSGTFNVYKFSDGIQSNEFSTGAYFTTRSGQMLVGGNNGFNVFYPQNIEDDLTQPLVVFTDFLLNNNKVPISAEPEGGKQPDSPLTADINQTAAVVLDHSDSVFTFEFAALHFDSPKQNQYAYRLLGFDQHWLTTDAFNRRATYTNMDAGEYVFTVKASNSDHVWSRAPRSIKVTVLPAPWRTWWAMSIYFVLIAGVVFSLLYLRFKKHQAAMQVKASEQQLSLALWGSGDQLWDWDKQQALLQRKNILSHFSFQRKLTLSQFGDLVLLLHPDDQDDFNTALAAHCSGEQAHFECAYRMKDKNGQWRWILDRGKIVATDALGNPERMAGTLQDIHSMRLAKKALRDLNDTLEQKVQQRTQALRDSIDQLKAAQQQLVEAEKMAALGNLVAGVAHEVNTPLGICITMVSLHLDKLKTLDGRLEAGTMTRKLLTGYLQDSLVSQALVESNLYRAAELIQSFKKVAVEHTEDSFDPIHFHDHLQDIVRNIVPRLKDSQIVINLLSAGDWVIETYPGAWWQLLSNLVDNSLSHGFLHKSSGEITLSAKLEQNRLIFTYRDNGHGMTAVTLEKMYEPFYTTARGRGGTGLGMHIVFNLVVQKLGGCISCQSEPGQGVVFIIDVPLKHNDPQR